MKGIIILAHGSREPEVERCVNRIVKEFKSRSGITTVESAYLMSVEHCLEISVKRIISLGVSELFVIPLFLFDGTHMKHTIPNDLNRLAAIYPDISIKLGKTLCTDFRILDLLLARANEMGALIKSKELPYLDHSFKTFGGRS